MILLFPPLPQAAVDHLTRCAAIDLAPLKIRVNSANPGVTRSELQLRGGLDESAYAAFLERSKVTHPLGRIAEAEEVAHLVAFLANNDAAGFITGAGATSASSFSRLHFYPHAHIFF